MIVDKFGQNVDRETLLNNLFVGIKIKEIELYREQHKQEVADTLKEQLISTKEQMMSTKRNPRLDFVSKFQLYQGLVRYYTENKEKG